MMLWVYGSLRRGEEHHRELDGAPFLGLARSAPRYALTRLGRYPALVAGSQSVPGEVYEVSQELLLRLDEFEDCPELFVRGNVVLEDGREAFAYFGAGSR